MTHDDYAQALITMAERGSDMQAVMPKLKVMLSRRGQLSLAPKIASALNKRAHARLHTLRDVLVVARTEDVAHAPDELKGKGEVVSVDPTLIGGWRHIAGGRLTDASYKRSLLTLYRSLIS